MQPAMEIVNSIDDCGEHSLTKSTSCVWMRLLRLFTGDPLKNQWTVAVGCEYTKHSSLACMPGRVWTTGCCALISGATGKMKTYLIASSSDLNWLTIYDEEDSSWFWLFTDSVIGYTLDSSRHIVMLHLDRQPSLAIVSVRDMHAVVEPGDNWVRDASRFTRYLKQCTERHIHRARRKSHDFWLD